MKCQTCGEDMVQEDLGPDAPQGSAVYICTCTAEDD